MHEPRTIVQHGSQPRWHPSSGSRKLTERWQQMAMVAAVKHGCNHQKLTAAEEMCRGCGTGNKRGAAMQSSNQHLSAACHVGSLLLFNRSGYYFACISTLLHVTLSYEREAYTPSTGFCWEMLAAEVHLFWVRIVWQRKLFVHRVRKGLLHEDCCRRGRGFILQLIGGFQMVTRHCVVAV